MSGEKPKWLNWRSMSGAFVIVGGLGTGYTWLGGHVTMPVFADEYEAHKLEDRLAFDAVQRGFDELAGEVNKLKVKDIQRDIDSVRRQRWAEEDRYEKKPAPEIKQRIRILKEQENLLQELKAEAKKKLG